MTREIAHIYPLTFAQAGLLVSTLAEAEPGLYIVQMRFALAGQLDRRRLRHAWGVLTARHDVLRTGIVWDQVSKPVNVVMTQAAMPVDDLDLAGLDACVRSTAVQNFLEMDRRRGFDLQQAPLSRITLLVFGQDKWEMVWTHHHAILDGWSTARLMAELWSAYAGCATPPAALPFRGFVSALAADTERNKVRNEVFWRDRITSGTARLTLDRPRSAPTAATWLERELNVAADQLDRWLESSRRHGVTLSTLYHAGWALTLRGNGLGLDDLVFGTVADTRGLNGSDVIGLCIATVPLRAVFDDRPVGVWLRGIGRDRANSEEHAATNFAEHRTWSRDASGVPFQYVLAVEGYAQEGLIDPDTGDDALRVRYLGVRESTQYALTAGVPAGSPHLKLTFDTRRIAASDATALLNQWAATLDALSGLPSDMPVTALLGAVNQAAPWRTLPERIGALADEHPDRLAFRDASTHLTLKELYQSSQRVACRLHAEGLCVGDRVGVLVDDSVHVAVAILATLMASGVLIALDPRHPAPYRAAVLSTETVQFVLTSQPDARPEWADLHALSISELLRGTSVGEIPETCSGRVGTAFVVYGTGSALRPTSTAYSHDAVLRTATEFADLLRLTVGDEWLVTRPATGAAAPWEMWAAPLKGGCTIIAPGIQHDPDKFARVTKNESIAVVGSTRNEVCDLAEIIRGRGRLVVATRTDTEITLWSAAGDRIGQSAHSANRNGPAALLEVEGILVDSADIELPLLAYPGVTSCVVRQQDDHTLQAVIGTNDAQIPGPRLTRFLRSSSPEALVPEIVLAETTAISKGPQQLRVESEICQMWSRVLAVREVPLDTPFFDLGGNSLMLFAVLSDLKKLGWTTIDMTDLFAHPTIRSLSKRLNKPADQTTIIPPLGGRQRPSAVSARRERGRK